MTGYAIGSAAISAGGHYADFAAAATWRSEALFVGRVVSGFKPHHIDDAEGQCDADAQYPGEVPHDDFLACSMTKKRAGRINTPYARWR